MVAMAILAIALGAVFSSEAGSVRMAARARKLGWASLLVRCKMGEIEEQIAKEGFPAMFDEGEDNCCTEAEIEGYTCKWEIEPVTMPDTMFESEGEGEGSEENDGDPKTSKADTKVVDAKTSQKEKREDLSEVLKDPKKLLGGGSATMGGNPFGGGGDSDGEG